MNTVAPTRGVTSFLLGHDHGPEFAGHARSVASGHHEAGDEGAEFGDHPDRNQLPDKRDPAETLESIG